MIKARTRRIIQGSDYSAQEPRVLSQLCEDEGMLQAYRDNKDLYVEIAAIAMHLPYKECLEHFPKNCPIKQVDGKWVYAKLKSGEDDDKKDFKDLNYDNINVDNYDYDKLADGETDTYKLGKERRGQAKRILLGIMYGRGERSIAEQLGCDVEEARQIKNDVYDAFPRIKTFERDSQINVKTKGYVCTLWGRKRHLPDYNLPNYSFKYIDPTDETKVLDTPVPEDIQNEYTAKLQKTFWKGKDKIIEDAKTKDGILIIDNNSKIAAAGRQIINAQVQGCLAANTKIITQELGKVNISDVANRSDLHVWDGKDWSTCDILPSGKKQKCVITLENGNTITCSPDHKFKVKYNDTYIWKACKDLTDEDDILIEDEL